MLLRNGKTIGNKTPLYSVNIDFDEAERCWRKNKFYLGNGCFRYKSHKRKNKKIRRRRLRHTKVKR